MQTSRELVQRAIQFNYPERLPVCIVFERDSANWDYSKELREKYDSDMVFADFDDPEFVPVQDGATIWGYKMETFGETMGEVKDYPLEDWDDFDFWKEHLPDFSASRGYETARKMREQNPDKFMVGALGMMMENIINLRGYENCMIDYYDEEENLKKLIEVLYDCGKKLVDGFADAGMDAVMAWEDWGLQNTTLISRSLWDEFYCDHMKDFVEYIHSKGMKYILHSCGQIMPLLDTFVEFGVDMIQMDQQMNMGLSNLKKWCGKICFLCPVDIQHSVDMKEEDMEAYVQQMFECLDTGHGGFIYKTYPQPIAIHMSTQQLEKEIQIMQNLKYEY